MNVSLKWIVNKHGMHHFASHHRFYVEKASLCGCFYCLEIYPPASIKKWIDAPHKDLKGRTATCPNCHVDAVLPDRVFGFRVTKKLLKAMQSYWFSVSKVSKP